MAFNDSLYLRKAELVVGPKIAGSNFPIEPPDARKFLTRIQFKVDKDETSNSNKAVISVFNLSEESRTFIENEDSIAFLNVGYGEILSNIFFGDIQRFYEKRIGPDLITTIECGDSEKALKSANIQIGLAKGATNIQVLNAAAAKLLVSTGFKTTIPKITYRSGFSFSGQVRKLLDDLTKQVNLTWSIQDGELQIIGPKETDKQQAILITKDTGLIGFPTTKDKTGVEFKSLINHNLRPGRAVRLESKRFQEISTKTKNSRFSLIDGLGVDVKVTKSSFNGDTHEGEFFVQCEGKIIG